MRNKDFFKDKKVTVVGFARSGLACANLLFDLGARVSITDNKDNQSTRSNSGKLKSKEIKVELGLHTKEFVTGRDILIISPGVPANALPIIWAGMQKIPVISEIEAAWILCPSTIIAVTGSSGKTTVTTLIAKVIEASGKKAFTCGNIGTPFSAQVSRMREGDFVCLEVSSFQLEHIKDFSPKIAVMLNFSRNHLDRHKDMKEYLDAKKRIFRNQKDDDFLVLNETDEILRGLAAEPMSKVIYFKESKEFNPNQAAVLAVGSILGIDKDICLKVFNGFKGLEHRFEQVAEINGIKFINDSKATVVESAVWAIKNINAPITLIAGGRHKGVDYKGILPEAKKKVKEVIVIGEAKEEIKKALSAFLTIKEAKTLEEAVILGFKDSEPGDYVLLSPMCSSFDMFSDYEERGRVFKDSVRNLAKEEIRHGA